MKRFKDEKDKMDFLTNQGKYLKQHIKDLAEKGEQRTHKAIRSSHVVTRRQGTNTPYND